MNQALNEIIENGVYNEPTRVKVSEWLKTFIETYKRDLRPKTVEGYNQMINLYIVPAFGGTELQKLRVEQIQKLYNDMADKNFSTSTIRQTHIVLNSAMKQAILNGYIKINLCTACVVPKTKKRKARGLEIEEQKAFINACSNDNLKFRHAYMLLLYTGMRTGECLGLKWSDVDMENKVIMVQRTLMRVKKLINKALLRTIRPISTAATPKPIPAQEKFR